MRLVRKGKDDWGAARRREAAAAAAVEVVASGAGGKKWMVWVGAVWVRMCQAGLSIRGTTHSRTQYPVKTTTTTVVPEYYCYTGMWHDSRIFIEKTITIILLKNTLRLGTIAHMGR